MNLPHIYSGRYPGTNGHIAVLPEGVYPPYYAHHRKTGTDFTLLIDAVIKRESRVRAGVPSFLGAGFPRQQQQGC